MAVVKYKAGNEWVTLSLGSTGPQGPAGTFYSPVKNISNTSASYSITSTDNYQTLYTDPSSGVTLNITLTGANSNSLPIGAEISIMHGSGSGTVKLSGSSMRLLSPEYSTANTSGIFTIPKMGMIIMKKMTNEWWYVRGDYTVAYA